MKDKKFYEGVKRCGNCVICLFMEVVAGKETMDVPDPYYTGDFEETYRLVEAGTSEWLKKIKAQLKD